MKFLYAIIFLCSTLILYANEHNFQAGGGVQFNLRLTFNQRFEPGAGSGGLNTFFKYQYKKIFVESAVTYEISGIGMQLLFPITLGASFFESNKISLDVFGKFYSGIGMFLYNPPAIIGTGTGVMLNLKITNKLGVRFYNELRYLTSPQYSEKVANYHTVEIPFGISLYCIW